jgi:hypothetical protein
MLNTAKMNNTATIHFHSCRTHVFAGEASAEVEEVEFFTFASIEKPILSHVFGVTSLFRLINEIQRTGLSFSPNSQPLPFAPSTSR